MALKTCGSAVIYYAHVKSGQVQVRYLVSTTYYLLPTQTTDYRLPTTRKAKCLSKGQAYNAYREEHLSAYNACRRKHAYNAYREAHLPAYKMDVDDYFGSQKTLVFSGRTGSQGQSLNAYTCIKRTTLWFYPKFKC